jgi:hypothetical protein
MSRYLVEIVGETKALCESWSDVQALLFDLDSADYRIFIEEVELVEYDG